MWDNTRKTLTLQTLLEGEALAVWVKLSEAKQGDYKVVKEKLIAKLRPALAQVFLFVSWIRNCTRSDQRGGPEHLLGHNDSMYCVCMHAS